MLRHSCMRCFSKTVNARAAVHFSTVAKNVTFSENGKVSKVLKLADQQLADPTGSDVLIKMLAAPINPADFNMIEGTYPIQPEADSDGNFVAGNEGVGVVEATGPEVTGLSPGDWVVPARVGFGTWRTHALAEESAWQRVDNDIPVELAATIAVNPATAWRMIHDFVQLKPDDVIIQNCANSAVGQCVIQIAHALGLRTINLIRNRPNFTETVERLKGLGGDIVVTDEYARTAEFRTLTADMPKPKLGLNAAGGPAATEVARLLGKGGTMVTYGGMSRKPVTLPTGLFIFNDICLRGFWVSSWSKEHSAEERTKMFSELTNLIRQDKLKIWLERHKFSDALTAVQKAQEQFRDRKIILMME
eukprot:28917_1